MLSVPGGMINAAEPKQRAALQQSMPQIRIEGNNLSNSNPISIARPYPANKERRSNRSASISPDRVVQYSPDMCSVSPGGKFVFSPSRYWLGYGDLTDTDQEASPSNR